jgi:transcriptional regulator with XRE-family HTH domain
MEVGRVLHKWRKHRGLTQAELSERTGLSQVFISLIESDKKNPSIETLEQLCRCLDVPVAVVVFQASTEDDIDTDARRAIFKELRSALSELADEAFK